MSRHTLALVYIDLEHEVKQSQRLAITAEKWLSYGASSFHPKFTNTHRDMLVELAFMRSYLAWERFLEESFILYLLGKQSPRRYAPKRFAYPPSRDHAIQMTLPDGGRSYADWSNATNVCTRAKHFFAQGEPYVDPLNTKMRIFNNLRTIRNAISHRSAESQESFDHLVRDTLGYLPKTFSIGKFLSTTHPKSTMPVSFFDHYLAEMMRAAKKIVPV